MYNNICSSSNTSHPCLKYKDTKLFRCLLTYFKTQTHRVFAFATNKITSIVYKIQTEISLVLQLTSKPPKIVKETKYE